ncbi:MAG: hypothetical protein RL266_85 [Bacteroidota bacterium]|jgi:hypothetical protein
MRSLDAMRTVIIVLCMYLQLTTMVVGQELEYDRMIPGSFDMISTDHIGKVYVTKHHELFLYSEKGDLLYQFSDLSRGEIEHLDTRNPLKILLFYPDYSQIVFLDNTLSRTRENVNLMNLGLELARLACTSFDNGFWVYDPVSFRLVRFDQGLNLTNEVANINQLLGVEINPAQMVEDDSWLYLHDPEYGVFVFDSFGTYTKLIPIKGAQQVIVRSNGIFFLMKTGLIKYDPLSFDQLEIILPTDDFSQISIEKKQLFMLNDQGVLVYRID